MPYFANWSVTNVPRASVPSGSGLPRSDALAVAVAGRSDVRGWGDGEDYRCSSADGTTRSRPPTPAPGGTRRVGATWRPGAGWRTTESAAAAPAGNASAVVSTAATASVTADRRRRAVLARSVFTATTV